jgi:aspartyl/asparaginyl-tRNA synthetase
LYTINSLGILMDFDMIYPEGLWEASVGAERETHCETVAGKMKSSGENPKSYE